MVGAFRNLASLLFVLCIPAALLTTNIRFLANEPRVYRYAIDKFDAVQTTKISRDQLLSASDQLRAYFRNSDDTVSIRVQQNGKDVLLFNPRETAHLKDVKDRFHLANVAQELSLLYILAFIALVVLWAKELSPQRLAVLAALGCLVTLGLIGTAGGVSMMGFDSAWERLHLLIFSNDFWRLNPYTDHLIQMFPLPFWQNIVFLLGVLVAAEAGLLLLAAGIYLGVTSRNTAAAKLAPSYG